MEKFRRVVGRWMSPKTEQIASNFLCSAGGTPLDYVKSSYRTDAKQTQIVIP